jgi:predicted RNase H-like HicB family nuclease
MIVNGQELLVIFEPSEHGYSAWAPDLPGCVAAGATVEETVDLMRAAIEMRLEEE